MFEIQQKLLQQRFKISGYEIFIAWFKNLVGTSANDDWLAYMIAVSDNQSVLEK